MFIFKFFDKKDIFILIWVYFVTLIWVIINSAQWFLIGEMTDQFFKVQENGQMLTYKEAIEYSLKLFGFIIGCNIIGFSLKFYTRMHATKIALTLSFKIRNKLFYSFLLMKENDINKIGISSINNRLTNDLNELQNTLINTFTFLFERIAVTICCIVYSLILSPLLSLIYPIILAVVILFSFYANKKSYKYYIESNKSLDGTNRVMRENIVGNKIIRSFSLLDEQSARFEQYNKKWNINVLKGDNLIYSIFVFILVIINTLTVFLLIIGGVVNYNQYFFGGTKISIGLLVAFINYLWETIFAVSSMFEVYVSFNRVKPIFKRVKEILNSNKENIDQTNENQKIQNYEIVLQDVNFKYENDSSWILENINVKFEKNKIYGLIGPTGSGKSTLINLICNLYDVEHGSISIGGIDYKNLNQKNIRDNISISFQEKLIYQGTFKSNILMGKNDATDEEIKTSLIQAQAYDFVSKKGGVDEIVSEKGLNLSGGQKQRLSLARAFIKQANILILDDSLSALDNVTRDKVITTIKKDFKDKTIIISGQQIKTISFADEILVFNKGKIIDKGNHNHLLKKCILYKDIYDSQKTIGE